MGNSKRRLRRRQFLAGAGATALALPWLESLSGGRASAQPQTPYRRLVIVSAGHSPQSVENDAPDWRPSRAGAYTTLPRLLTPFENHLDMLTTVGGVDNVVADQIDGDNHMVSSFTMLTCQAHREGVDGGRIVRGMNTSGTSLPLGPSIDYAIADGLGQSPLTLRAGFPEAASRRTFGLDGSYDPGESNPSRAFDHLFGSLTPTPTELSPREQLAARRLDLLDAVRARYASMATRVSRADRIRMEAHQELIHQFQSELDRTTEIVCTDPARPNTTGVSNFDQWDGRNDDVLGAAHNSLVATAFACQAAQVASIHYSSFGSNTFPFLNGGQPFDFPGGWHETVHGHGTPELRQAPMRWYHDMVVDLVDKLRNIPEGDGSVFDSTIVLFTTNLASLLHGRRNVPIILMSGERAGLPRGQHLEVERRSLADFWTTLSTLMGVPMDSFGWDESGSSRPFNSGPIAELIA